LNENFFFSQIEYMLIHPRLIRPRQFSRLFCSVFELRAAEELSLIADKVDHQIDRLGGEAVEFHDGVLTIEFPTGTFVVNKHFASKQIWYSSPVSPPAYFDRVDSKWWSEKLRQTVREKLREDITKLTGLAVELDEES
jgi:frataxin-like iron-binding protein CyaY